MVNVLVVGSGGREHAIGWKLSQNDSVDRVNFYAEKNKTKDNHMKNHIISIKATTNEEPFLT